MSRKTDLETAIRESNCIITEYEAVIRTSSRPEEKIRAQNIIREQRALFSNDWREYSRLMDQDMPYDIYQIVLSLAGSAVVSLIQPHSSAIVSDDLFGVESLPPG